MVVVLTRAVGIDAEVFCRGQPAAQRVHLVLEGRYLFQQLPGLLAELDILCDLFLDLQLRLDKLELWLKLVMGPEKAAYRGG